MDEFVSEAIMELHKSLGQDLYDVLQSVGGLFVDVKLESITQVSNDVVKIAIVNVGGVEVRLLLGENNRILNVKD